MSQIKLNEQDLKLLNKKNIRLEEIENQLRLFEKGFPFLTLINSASTSNGSIKKLTEIEYLIDKWNHYLTTSTSIVKFVPASGAATRMFKDLFQYLNNPSDSLEKNKYVDHFLKNIQLFAFFDDLNLICKNKYSKSVNELIQRNKERSVIDLLLNKDGLNYGNLPKGLLKFHLYKNDIKRTPLEEHLVEGFLYANNNGIVKIHFTVSNDHQDLFNSVINQLTPLYSDKLGVKYEISFSIQQGEKDTIAVDLNNEPFRENGKLLFRPSGHGALLENLNDLDGDIIFIKNIDNVVPDSKKNDEIRYKKVLAGYLIKIQETIFEYLKLIESAKYNSSDLHKILSFIEKELCIKNSNTQFYNTDELISYLFQKLNRPIRVCGMVKNIGEPGGGPFVVRDKDNSSSLQILESTQIDKQNAEALYYYNNSTHFNPVDIVCGIKDYKGNKFDLRKFVDADTGFISLKSKNGKELKALELPGLWNGSMSDWNTIFVEVPLSIFNPVKTVSDLLREQHQQ